MAPLGTVRIAECDAVFLDLVDGRHRIGRKDGPEENKSFGTLDLDYSTNAASALPLLLAEDVDGVGSTGWLSLTSQRSAQ